MFIVFEGLDGCGKTTQIKLLEKKLKDLGYDNVKIMREPGSTELSESIRAILQMLRGNWNELSKMAVPGNEIQALAAAFCGRRYACKPWAGTYF